MKRLTKENVKDMNTIELALNQAFVKDRWAWYRDYDREVSAINLAKEMLARNGICEYPTDDEEFDGYMEELLFDNYETIDGMIAIIYRLIWSMAEVRESLKRYEDLEEQGLLIRLPCRVGDRLYRIDTDSRIDKREIETIYIDNIVINENGDILYKYDAWDGVICDLKALVNKELYLDFYKVFLTEEEARAVLDKLN